MIGTIARTSKLFARNVMKSQVRTGYRGGTPCENMPFDSSNKAWITWNFIWYGVTGMGAPFVILLFQMGKK